MTAAPIAAHAMAHAPRSRSLLGAIGVVFGDIGTSPLYTIKEAFCRTTASTPTTPPCSASCRWCSGR